MDREPVETIELPKMPDLKYHLTKRGFTPEEIRLADTIEKIVFRLNHSVHPDENERGVRDDELRSELSLINITSNETFFQNTLKKCEDNQILAKVDGLWFSTTYFS